METIKIQSGGHVYEFPVDPLALSSDIEKPSESERIISIIRKHRDELETQAQRYDAMDWQHIPQETRDRKFSVIDAEMRLLRNIIEEIGVEHFEKQETTNG